MKRTSSLVLALAVSSLLVTACGDDKKDTKTTAAAGTTATAGSTASGGSTAPTATTPTGTTPASGTTAAGDGGSAAGGPYCVKVAEYKAASDVVGNLLEAVPPDAAKLQAAFADLKQLMPGMTSDAPAEIKAEVATVLSTSTQFFEVLQRNSFDVVKVQANAADTAAIEAITGNTLVNQASDKLAEYAKTVCKLES